jgi:hypothetical protein
MAAKNPFDALHISLNEYALSLWGWWLPNVNVFSCFGSSKYSDLIIRCEARLGTGYLDSMITGIAHNINLRSLGSGRRHNRAQRRQCPRC